MSDGEIETVKVEVTNVSKLQKELAEIKEQMKKAEEKEGNAKTKMEKLETFRNRRETNTFRGQRMPPRDSRRDDRRGRFRDRRDSRRDNRGERNRDRRGRDRFGRQELERREKSEEKIFYGLARSTDTLKQRPRRKNKDGSEERNNSTTYKSKYADAESSSEEEEELPPTQMISLVTVNSDKEDGEKSGSDSESDSDSASEAAVKEEPTTSRGRKRGRDGKSEADRKRRRVNILASMKKDKNNQTRSKRLFGFMMNHLGRARKESKNKPDLQSTITKKAQELKTQQKRIIEKAFQEKQKEKYEARLEFQRKTLEVQQWKKKHIENLLRADGMKTELKQRCELIDGGTLMTTSMPPITWIPASELDQEFMVSLQEKGKEGLRSVLNQEIQEMMDNEGEEPEEPEPLPRKYQVSPIRGRREDDDQEDGRKRFGLKREGGFGSKREEPSRRDRSRERSFRKNDSRDNRRGRMPRKEINTSKLRHRRREPRSPRRTDDRRKERARSPVKEEQVPQPAMMSLVSVAED